MGHHVSLDYLILLFFGAICHMLVSNLLILSGLQPRTAIGTTLLALVYPPFIAMIISVVAPDSRISTQIYRAYESCVLLYGCIFISAGVLNLGYLVVWLLVLS